MIASEDRAPNSYARRYDLAENTVADPFRRSSVSCLRLAPKEASAESRKHEFLQLGALEDKALAFQLCVLNERGAKAGPVESTGFESSCSGASTLRACAQEPLALQACACRALTFCWRGRSSGESSIGLQPICKIDRVTCMSWYLSRSRCCRRVLVHRPRNSRSMFETTHGRASLAHEIIHARLSRPTSYQRKRRTVGGPMTPLESGAAAMYVHSRGCLETAINLPEVWRVRGL
jgi:hypothetical protein